MKTSIEMITELHQLITKNGSQEETLYGGFHKFTLMIGVSPVTATTCDEGYTKGIFIPDLLNVYHTYGREEIGFMKGDEELLTAIYNIAMNK